MLLYRAVIIIILCTCCVIHSKAEIKYRKYSDEAVELWDAIHETTATTTTTTKKPETTRRDMKFFLEQLQKLDESYHPCPLTCK